jgi:hypothetical protein
LFSASLRSVAVATPPTPVVLQTAELGGSGPGMLEQPEFDVQLTPVWILQWPACGQGVFTSQDWAIRLQLPEMAGHWPLLVQDVSVCTLQWPAIVLHWPLLVQAVVVWILHFPELGQLPGPLALVQLAPETLHLPPMMAQVALVAQLVLSLLQVPMEVQSAADRQLAFDTLHTPG